jgi:hypothetical protein
LQNAQKAAIALKIQGNRRFFSHIRATASAPVFDFSYPEQTLF